MNRKSIGSKVISTMIIFMMIMVFVSLDSGAAYAASAPKATGKITASAGAVLRKSPSATSSKVTTLSKNTTVTITNEVFTSKTSTSAKTRWYYVKAGSKKGYVRADLIGSIKYSAVSGKVTSSLNYRKGAGTSMEKAGNLKKGIAITLYLTATPVSSTTGPSAVWYKTKIDSKYYYVCSSNVDIVGSIFVNNTTTPDPDSSSSDTPANDFAAMSDSEFTSYLTKQGFPSAYRKKLLELHKKHPNWVFIAEKTGISWEDALKKETRDGVSLIHSSLPLSYRSTDSNSYTGGSITVYKNTSTETKVTTVKSGESLTLLTEVWKGTTRWSKIKTSSGTKGYIKGTPASVTHDNVLSGKLNSTDVNVRKGAGTDNAVLKTITKKGTGVDVVLQVTDKSGEKWYKIRSGSGYGYLLAKYVDISTKTETETTVTTPSPDYSTAVLAAKTDYYAIPGSLYKKIGTFAADTEITLIASVTDSDGTVWYQAYNDGNIVYIKAEGITPGGEVAAAEMPDKFTGKTTATAGLNMRKSADAGSSIVCEIPYNSTVTILDAKNGGSYLWYSVKYDKKSGYAVSNYITADLAAAPENAAPVTTTEVVETEVSGGASSLTGSVSFKGSGSYIPKDGSSWFNASKQVVAYYMDPRNFLNEDRIYMFEELAYKKDYQTTTVVSKILSPTKLPGNGFTAKMFVDAGSAYNVSPVHLAARARQETGGGSIAITGYKINGVKVYNPFNIGASSGSNPVLKGLK